MMRSFRASDVFLSSYPQHVGKGQATSRTKPHDHARGSLRLDLGLPALTHVRPPSPRPLLPSASSLSTLGHHLCASRYRIPLAASSSLSLPPDRSAHSIQRLSTPSHETIPLTTDPAHGTLLRRKIPETLWSSLPPRHRDFASSHFSSLTPEQRDEFLSSGARRNIGPLRRLWERLTLP